MWSKIVDLHISRRWLLRAYTRCKLGPMICLVEAQV